MDMLSSKVNLEPKNSSQFLAAIKTSSTRFVINFLDNFGEHSTGVNKIFDDKNFRLIF